MHVNFYHIGIDKQHFEQCPCAESILLSTKDLKWHKAGSRSLILMEKRQIHQQAKVISLLYREKKTHPVFFFFPPKIQGVNVLLPKKDLSLNLSTYIWPGSDFFCSLSSSVSWRKNQDTHVNKTSTGLKWVLSPLKPRNNPRVSNKVIERRATNPKDNSSGPTERMVCMVTNPKQEAAVSPWFGCSASKGPTNRYWEMQISESSAQGSPRQSSAHTSAHHTKLHCESKPHSSPLSPTALSRRPKQNYFYFLMICPFKGTQIQ